MTWGTSGHAPASSASLLFSSARSGLPGAYERMGSFGGTGSGNGMSSMVWDSIVRLRHENSPSMFALRPLLAALATLGFCGQFVLLARMGRGSVSELGSGAQICFAVASYSAWHFLARARKR